MIESEHPVMKNPKNVSRVSNLRPLNQREYRGSTLPKTPTGIQGLDEITLGGLPKGRPTLICGSAGCGKTLLSIEFLVRGATQFNEPGVFMAFEETEEDLRKNVASLGYDLKELSDRKKLVVDYVYIERSEIEETGEYDLEGLFVRLGYAIDSIGAKTSRPRYHRIHFRRIAQPIHFARGIAAFVSLAERQRGYGYCHRRAR